VIEEQQYQRVGLAEGKREGKKTCVAPVRLRPVNSGQGRLMGVFEWGDGGSRARGLYRWVSVGVR